MEDKLSGEDAPRLHLVSFSAASEVHTALYNLAKETNGYFHSYHSTTSGTENGHPVAESESSAHMADTDIGRVKGNIVRAERVLAELKSLGNGAMGTGLLEILREVSAN